MAFHINKCYRPIRFSTVTNTCTCTYVYVCCACSNTLSRMHTSLGNHVHLILNIGSYHDMTKLIEALDSSSTVDAEDVTGI